MSRVEMMIEEYYPQLMGKGAKHLYEKLKTSAAVVQKYLPEYLNFNDFASNDESGARKLTKLIFQLIGEDRREKLTPYECFFIAILAMIYSRRSWKYESGEDFVQKWRIFQLEGCEFLEKKGSEMGLEEIEVGILKMIGFADVVSEKERGPIANKILRTSNVSIRIIYFLFLEAIFKLAFLLDVEVICLETGTNMIKSVTIDHLNQKISIEAVYRESYGKKRLDKFCFLVNKELKTLQDILKESSVLLNVVTLNSRIKKSDFTPNEDCFSGRETELKNIFREAEKRKVTIVTGNSGVGISTTLKCGVAPFLKSHGLPVVYCSVSMEFQQTIVRELDKLFPRTRAEKLFPQLEMLFSENHKLVIILDHFEKVFSLEDSKKLTIEMLEFLIKFGKLGDDNFRIIIGVAGDSLNTLEYFLREIQEFYTEEAFVYLKNFDRKSAKEVMEKMIEQKNYPVDNQLIEDMLDELLKKEDTISPPLIHFLFLQLIEMHKARYFFGSENNPFRLSFYKELKGAGAVLLDYARAKLEKFTDEEKDVTIEVIQRLISPYFSNQKQHIDHREIIDLNDDRVDIEKLLHRLLQLRFLNRIQTTNGYKYELIHDFLEKLVPKKPEVTNVEDTSFLVREAIAFIDENYNRAITLQEVAKKVGVTPEYLSKVFKAGCKQGFKQYLTHKRIEEAKLLLVRFPELSIKELSKKMGFASANHFSTFFKSETDLTPLKYRQKNIQQSGSTEKSSMRTH